MTSIFHQPVLGVHIMSHQNSVFIAFINQRTDPAKVGSIPVSESSHSLRRLPQPSLVHCGYTDITQIYTLTLCNEKTNLSSFLPLNSLLQEILRH
uniref:Uncharacterized protein n=1 Tax=Serinus canaria TaxID=9135 RepID=A0A8C9UET6_SERCA